MKKITSIFASLALVALVSCGGGETPPVENTTPEVGEETTSATYTINAEESVVKWTGGMIAAYEHTGMVKVAGGTFTTENGAITSGTVTIDMTTIGAVDENFNPDAGQTREALAGHLSSADFFDVENHPTATFTIDNVGGKAIAGDLTIKGVSKNVKIGDTSLNEKDGGASVGGTFTFNRQDFGVTYANTMSDMVISDDVSMTFRLIGK
jgi:polyisoprenoid-binding protein YceI